MPTKNHKKIHFIRHAKSSWKEPSLNDIERPLNARGERSCKLMAKPVFDAGCNFQHVYLSPAKRALMTLQGFEQVLEDITVDSHIEEELFTFDDKTLLKWLRKLPPSLDETVVIGHNPAITDLCNRLTNQFIENIPTCGYVQVVFSVSDWSDLGDGCGEVVEFITPKTLV